MIANFFDSRRYGFLHVKRRSTCHNRFWSLLLSIWLGLTALADGQSASANEQGVPALFVGDEQDSSVKQFDSSNGTFLGDFVAAGSAGLSGPTGMIFTDGELVVVNQNVGLPISGEVFRYDGRTGTFLGKLVAASDRNAPYAPRGIVRGGPDDAFYLADDGTLNNLCTNQGDIKEYNDAGAFLGNLDHRKFNAAFYPRGVVFGPDGLLYVSARGCPVSTDPNDALIGYVLRFNPRTKQFVDVFASNTGIPDLHRPEGLVFDPDGNLWVTSFRNASDANGTDKILKLNGKTGRLLDELELSAPGAPRAFAQAIIFGPGGKLFIPITGGDTTTAGQVRRCDTTTKACDVIVPAGGPLQVPFYPIFRKSNPATLDYGDDEKHGQHGQEDSGN